MARWKAMVFAGAAVAAALVPLYGDPRRSPVTHEEWARLMVRGLGMEEALQSSPHASDVFDFLSWRQSLSFPAIEFTRADGVEPREAALLATGELGGEVAYPLTVVRGGDYGVRLRLRGDPGRPVQVELALLGQLAPVANLTAVPGQELAWVDVGEAHLDRGSYSVSVLLPPGALLDYVEIAPPCLSPIEPPGGWRGGEVATNEAVAATLVKALRWGAELPPAGMPIEVPGARFQPITPVTIPAALQASASFDATWLHAGTGLQALVFVDVPEPGLYSVSVFGIEGGGQSWLASSCNKSVLCPQEQVVGAEATPEWLTLMTAEFSAGRHDFVVTLGPGAAVGRLRFEKKSDEPEDYLATARRMGCDPGPDGQPITRDQAVDMMNCLAQQMLLLGEPCGDITLPDTLIAGARGGQPGLLAPAPGIGPVAPPPFGGVGQPPFGGIPPIPPEISPQPPASPVTP